jgi:hypothetical protein
LSGKVALGAIKALVKNMQLATQKVAVPNAGNLPFQQSMAHAWTDFGGRILLVLSGSDYTAKEFLEYAGAHPAWSSAFQHARLERHDMVDADHTFSHRDDSTAVENTTLHWLMEQAANESAVPQ